MSTQPEKEDLADADTVAVGAKHGGRSRHGLVAFAAIVLVCAGIAATIVALRPTDATSAIKTGHYSIARDLLEQAARGGDARAQNTLANLYYLGLGGPTDQHAAATWYLESALQGNTDAQINMARHYVLGLGVSKDPMRAFAWLFHARSAGREVAEGDIKLLAGSAQITPTHLQRVRQLYPTIESLRPNGDGE